ncbi:RidA family protein [Alicyclobacillus acidoterrestris]|uniref:RidA family protein n=1 Tax=Alicyclobacillus acidoterrestris (strain ATCC 49025 / DSM 3922 / CIP 106132 / NCIMB 13137 / GD3B) TaxID=1356854 RepID=T0DUG8_ALIAG|nr:RidA family protein [Alicyclobacillus acidoterrestris]EPZ53111.1 hypothetical protein N007_18185 [Alicyclobacillus acidoterrestris ATCC 49025]UNO47690.1 RidA family protein [Alicyclobacillus acidoterrestris]
MLVSERLKQLGITLPPPPKVVAAYVPAITVHDLVYTSGNDCRVNGELMYKGKVGLDLTLEEGQRAARQTTINLLAVLQEHLGSLDKIERIVKLLGFVNSAPGFVEQPHVMNGASMLLEDIFGAKGKHARSALAAPELPFNTPVEIEMIVQLKQGI